jgi:translocation and assembly module TamB
VKEGLKKRGSRWRWPVIGLLAVAGVPLLLAAVMQTPWMREYARQQAEAALRRELGLSGVVEGIEVEPRTLTFIANGITLDHPQHGRFVEAEQLRIRPSWWALLHGRIDLHNISIERASVWLVLRDGKLINGPQPKPSAGGGGFDVDLPFDKLYVHDSRLFIDGSELGSAELAGIEVALDSTRSDALGIRLHSPAGLIKHARGQERIEGIEARAKLTNRDVSIELLRVHNSDVSLSVSRAALQLKAAGAYHGDVELSAHLDRLEHWPLPFELPHVEGLLHARVHVARTSAGITASGHVSAKRAVLDQYGFGEDVELDLQLDPAQLQYQGVAQLIRKGGRVELSGTLGFGPKLPLTVSARVVDVEFAKLMEQLGVSPDAIVDWTLAGGFELHGTLDPLSLSGPLRMPTRDFHVMQGAWHAPNVSDVIAVQSATLNGNVLVKPDGIHLVDIDAVMRNSKLHVDEVLLGFDNDLRVRAVGEVLDLRDVPKLVGFPLGGRGVFNVHVDGTFKQPRVAGHLRFNDFAFATYPFGDVESDFVLERDLQAVRFPELVARKNESRYRASDFIIDFNDHRLAIEAGMRFEHFAMQDFYHVFHYENDERYTPFQAEVTGDAQLRFTRGFPGDSPRGTLRADVDLAIDEADLNGFHFSGGEAIGSWYWRDHALGYRGGALDVERFSLRKGDGVISVSGMMGFGGMLNMIVLGDKIAIRDTEGLRDGLPQLAGNYSVVGTIKGTAAVPLAELELTAHALTYNGELLGDARSYARLTGKNDPWVQAALAWPPGQAPADTVCPRGREGLARAEWPADPPLDTSDGPQPALDEPMAFLLCGSALDERVRFDVALGRTHVFPIRGEIEAHDLPIAKLMPKEKYSAERGTLSGRVFFQDGALRVPEALAGELHLDRIALGQAGVQLENEGPIDARFGEGSFALERAAFMGPGSEVRIEGGGSLRRGLGLNVSGSLDLSILPSFVRELKEASGSMQLEVKVSGALASPGIFGTARVDGASLRLASLPFPIDAIDARVTFSRERVLIERGSARMLSGTLSLSGAAALSGRQIGSYRLELAADRLTASPREGVDLTASGTGELSWKQGDRLPKLHGNLRLAHARYTRPISVGPMLDNLAKKSRTDVDTYDPADDHVQLDVRVSQSEPLRVDNNLIDAEIAIDDSKEPFRLLGTDQRFGILGNMDIRQGTVRVRDRPFTIKDGEITFENASRIEPRFDMHAATEVRRTAELGQLRWNVGVHAWGTPESFQFELTSDPYLAQDDIALLLAVGMTHVELAQMQTSTLTSTAAFEALAAVTGVEREVQRALPAIDDVHIASGYSPRTQRTEPQLHLGKRIADRVRLQASTALSQSRDFSTGVEYQISDKTSVGALYNNRTKLSASQLGDVGVDLKWRLEFD